MWKDLDAAKFREFESMIQSNHTMIGGVLCALTVKMDAWAKKFPDRDTGGPNRRADFIISEMVQGIENIGRSRPQSQEKAECTRVRTHYSHQMTAAARAIAAMKFLMLRSKRVAIRRQSLRRQNMRSMMLRCL